MPATAAVAAPAPTRFPSVNVASMRNVGSRGRQALVVSAPPCVPADRVRAVTPNAIAGFPVLVAGSPRSGDLSRNPDLANRLRYHSA